MFTATIDVKDVLVTSYRNASTPVAFGIGFLDANLATAMF
jgi:hypothetical protein